MTPRTLRVLEFSTIRDRLAALCASPLGREAAGALEPSAALDEVRLRQQGTSEARWLAETAGGLPVGGIHDIRDPVQASSRRSPCSTFGTPRPPPGRSRGS